MTIKKFRDSVYGYIKIPSEIVHSIIDTAAFQRLRNIRQTSYEPLYPGALHNRFVHSLGVYHLGKIAFSALRKSVESDQKLTKIINWDRYEYLFTLACLLHDIGHSPFSHTGEEFYTKSKSSKVINKDNDYSCQKLLSQLTDDEIFCSPKGSEPAPHEIMSCIVALENFGKLFNSMEERSFFARCITGLQYDEKINDNMQDKAVENAKRKNLFDCMIHMLHSSVIDVDRLDYIIRDAAISGYQSVSIDYERLLNGIFHYL